MGIRSRIFGWFRSAWVIEAPGVAPRAREDDEHDQAPESLRLVIRKANNGRLLSVQKYKPINGPGPDWETTLYLVPTGTSLIETITKALVLERLTE